MTQQVHERLGTAGFVLTYLAAMGALLLGTTSLAIPSSFFWTVAAVGSTLVLAARIIPIKDRH